MSEEPKQLPSDSQAFDNRLIFTVIICTLMAEALRGIKWLPYPIGLSLVYYLVFLIGYWIGRKPDLTFGRFVRRLTAYLLIFVAGLWAIPELLTRLVWRPAAYAAPVMAMSILAYWMRPLYPVQRKRGRFSIWLLCSIALAILYGWAMRSAG